MREVFKKYKNKKKDSEIWWAKEIRETLTPEKIGPMIFDVLKEYL